MKKQESPAATTAATTGLRAETKASLVELNGISLLEVLNLVYLGNDEIGPEQQLGKIKMEFHSGSKEFYLVEGHPSIKYGDAIFVTDDEFNGPICNVENLEIEYNLFRGAYKGSLEIAFEPVENKVWYEEHKMQSVDGAGQIRVVFGFLSNATVANLEISIRGATNVHGIVAARNSRLNHPSCTTVLFWKSSDNIMKVGSDGVIPLLKSRVGVPLDYDLYVDFALYIDGEIHEKTVYFAPQTRGGEMISIPNKETEISVKVKWDSRTNSVFSTYCCLYEE